MSDNKLTLDLPLTSGALRHIATDYRDTQDKLVYAQDLHDALDEITLGEAFTSGAFETILEALANQLKVRA